jgi:hypothetical protein
MWPAAITANSANSISAINLYIHFSGADIATIGCRSRAARVWRVVAVVSSLRPRA